MAVHEMCESNFGQLLNDIPFMVSNKVYSNMKDDKFPRFPTVFKLIKEEFKSEGYPFSMFTDCQKFEIEEMVRDVFYGIKMAER